MVNRTLDNQAGDPPERSPLEGRLADLIRPPIAGENQDTRLIDPLTSVGELFEPLEDKRVRCLACGHRCQISPSGRGICQVRYNLGGKLYVPWGYVAALQVDPTEKKPFFHVLPGSNTLTFGMLGCDMHCPYCQNWDISQALRDKNAGRPVREVSPEQLVDLARQTGSRCIASSYNEPLITAEWAASIFQKAAADGLVCLFVSNGNTTPTALEFLRPYTAGIKIDLKTFQDRSYRRLGAVMDKILDGIRQVYAMGFWLEIVTLIIPGFNDSEDELHEISSFICDISPSIPWHVTAFHKDYRMTEPENTGMIKLVRAAEIGYESGLQFVYAGNLPGQVGPYENTYCPGCGGILIERSGFRIIRYRLSSTGQCLDCGTRLPGIWPGTLPGAGTEPGRDVSSQTKERKNR